METFGLDLELDNRARTTGGYLFSLVVVLFSASPTLAQAPTEQAAVATTSHFAFHSDFTTNVNDALLEAGRARGKGKPELFQSGDEASCFDKLPPSVRTAWNLAVDYYTEVVSPKRWSDRWQVLIRFDLSGVKELSRAGDRRYVGIVRSFIEAAKPAYEACRWTTQEAKNRRWIESLVAQLKVHEEAVSQKLANLYARPLGGLPIRVDVVETVNWSGATTWILDPDGGHIVISTVEEGPVSLEYIFHEASHTLMRREDPLQLALRNAADKLDVELPRDLWHAVLFYTTGDTVRRALAEAGEPAYTPMLFDGNIFGRHHAAMKRGWTGYLDGRRTLDEAAEDLLRNLL